MSCSLYDFVWLSYNFAWFLLRMHTALSYDACVSFEIPYDLNLRFTKVCPMMSRASRTIAYGCPTIAYALSSNRCPERVG